MSYPQKSSQNPGIAGIDLTLLGPHLRYGRRCHRFPSLYKKIYQKPRIKRKYMEDAYRRPLVILMLFAPESTLEYIWKGRKMGSLKEKH